MVAEWIEKIEWRSYSDQEKKYTETFHGFGLDIVLPLVYKINENWGVGADICICSSGGNITIGTAEYQFWNHNVFNVFFDYHL